MTGFLEDLQKVKMENENKNTEVANEIINYFRDVLKSEKFELELKNELIRAIKDNRTTYNTWVEFWNYSSGCSDTHFSVFRFWWTNKENSGYQSRRYKGVDLYDISRDVIDSLLRMYMTKLSSLGLSATYEGDECHLKYPKWKVTINLNF